MTQQDDHATFLNALQQAQKGFYFDAIEAFQTVLKSDASGPLADDAMFNIGACYMKVRQFPKAIEAFERVLSEYPQGVIESAVPGNEYGRTAAKALLGLVEASLLLNDRTKAEDYCLKLNAFTDSFVLRPDTGLKVLFVEIARSMIEAFDKRR